MEPSRDPLLEYAHRPNRRLLGAVVRAHYQFVWECAFRLTGHREDAAGIHFFCRGGTVRSSFQRLVSE